MKLDDLLIEGRAKLAANRQKEADAKAAEEAALTAARKESWSCLLSAARTDLGDLVDFVDTRLPENWNPQGDRPPSDGYLRLEVPGCGRLLARYIQVDGAWVRVPHQNSFGNPIGLWAVPAWHLQMGECDWFVSERSWRHRGYTDDLAEALAMAEEATAQRTEAMLQRDSRNQEKTQRTGEQTPSVAERLLAVLREAVWDVAEDR